MRIRTILTLFTRTMQAIQEPKQLIKSVSYKRTEQKVLKMEKELQDYYGYDYSGLHKTLVRDAFAKIRMI
ncbi:Hypothetical protein PMT_2340 [Prochlorococcus marinus str. MIT 9313]|uniref:Uncharacterized protein n=1 Tax=Prochlorococcus marinus (strain MIT 9313) TaxID=74547 RepID=B9ERG3_PROMM|nr:Hypothetical protein PMT_2340 [Prochlorococcus marinus str. MIT 9313]